MWKTKILHSQTLFLLLWVFHLQYAASSICDVVWQQRLHLQFTPSRDCLQLSNVDMKALGAKMKEHYCNHLLHAALQRNHGVWDANNNNKKKLNCWHNFTSCPCIFPGKFSRMWIALLAVCWDQIWSESLKWISTQSVTAHAHTHLLHSSVKSRTYSD